MTDLPSTSFDAAWASTLARFVVGDDLGLVGLEHLFVGGVRAKGLLVGKQEVAGKAVLHGDNVTDLAELFDAFEQDDFHILCSLFHDIGEEADVPRTLDRLCEFALLGGTDGGDA